MEHDIRQEFVKCVLVGDTATGKTRLVCARALNARVSLRQLLRQHVPTVWAIDQYRMYKEVLERSMTIVDGVQVSLRLWDTFGDHEKDRRFAYGRSDVILLCFSIGNKISLMHCKTMWFPEIRKFCPDTPIVLVGCKNDLRFLCKDSTYIAQCRDRGSPFVRPTKECDIVMPEQARALAKEFGVPYYETSVFTYYGVNQLFENAIRVALIARRRQRFWTNLKHVQPALLQAPYCPPKKEITKVEVLPETFQKDMLDMLNCKRYPDMVFAIGGCEITAHRFVIAAISPRLSKLMEPHEAQVLSRRNSETSTSTESYSTVDETECLLKPHSYVVGNLDEPQGFVNSVFSDSSEFDWKQQDMQQMQDGEKVEKKFGHIENVWNRASFDGVKITQVVLQLNETISPDAIRTLLNFIYTGDLLPYASCSFEELKRAAEVFDNVVINQYLQAWYKRELRLMTDFRRTFKKNLKAGMWSKCVEGYACDVIFELEDGDVPAHKALLMSRSEVMNRMFSGDFIEKNSSIVTISDVYQEAFLFLLEYLYTDAMCPVPCDTAVQILVLELGNRFCHTSLINYIECNLIKKFDQEFQNNGVDVLESCLKLLEPSQLHNIEHLAQWCLVQLATNYDLVCREHGKLFKELSPENRHWISQSRWPPVWYVKDFDYYQKSLMERYKTENSEKKSRKRNNSGCLCFPVKSRKSVLPYTPEDLPQDKSSNFCI